MLKAGDLNPHNDFYIKFHKVKEPDNCPKMTTHTPIRTNNKQTAELNELINLLSSLKREDEQRQNNSPHLGSFQSKLYEENNFTLNAKLHVSDKNHGIMGSLLNMAKDPVTNLVQKLYQIPIEEQECVNDDESIYEDANTVTKTIYRSNSFDDPIDELFDNSYIATNKTHLDESTSSLHGFNLENFTDTFNLDDDDAIVEGDNDDGREAMNTKKIKPEDKTSNTILEPNEIATNKNNLLSSRAKLTKKEFEENQELIKDETTFFPSISSSGSIPFNDILMTDILSDLNVEIDDIETSSQKSITISDEEINDCLSTLNINEVKIARAIISKLQQQLKPTLLKLGKDSKKYEIMKNLYKLPSISNLNEVILEKYANKGKTFNLEFHEDVIHGMINDEIIQTRKKVHNRVPLLSAYDQTRLNFNKFRALNTITEEQSFEITNNDIKENNILCLKLSYNKSKDFRKVSDIKTDELIEFLKLIRDGKLKDRNKVEHLVSLFEIDEKNESISKLNNSELESSILCELNKRKVI